MGPPEVRYVFCEFLFQLLLYLRECSISIRIFQRPNDVPRKSSSGSVVDAVLSYSSAGAHNLASLGASVGQSLISSVISSKPAPSTRSVAVKEEVEEDDSLSDTDGFEMISQDEFANM